MKHKKTQHIVAFLLIAVCVIFVVALFLETEHIETYNGPSVNINGRTISVDVAETPEAQRRGLSGRETLDGDAGMLFLFPEKQITGFWMKEMRFPIDIVWISEGEVIGIEKNIDPQIGAREEELKIYFPPSAVDAVLEIYAGKADEWGIIVGDKIISYISKPQFTISSE
jgi:uncharacterized membrane protein (UPF0127 family)